MKMNFTENEIARFKTALSHKYMFGETSHGNIEFVCRNLVGSTVAEVIPFVPPQGRWQALFLPRQWRELSHVRQARQGVLQDAGKWPQGIFRQRGVFS